MQRSTAEFPLTSRFREQLAAYASRFEEFALLDSCNNTTYGANTFDYLLAAGAYAVCAPGDIHSAYAEWEAFVQAHGDWTFGYLGYELNAATEDISPPQKKLFDTPPLRFFTPIILIRVNADKVVISVREDTICDTPEQIWQNIQLCEPHPTITDNTHLQPVITAEEYTDKVHRIRQHIIDGDIYELNLCQPFLAENTDLDPISAFNRLCEISQAPFSVLYRFGAQYLICGSPERFFQYDGRHMTSMPIKGTRRRDSDPAADARLREELAASEKDRAENVMIVDLVRNDLTPFAVPGTIRVEELFGVYAFPQVYQLVSKVRAELRPGVHVCAAIRQAFPMGSMTGAPKVRAMQIIAETENAQRGLYSGAFGYFTPEGHCDFNVVIRSMIYHADTRLLAAWAGGAIVYDSIPERELEECYVKLAGIERVLHDR